MLSPMRPLALLLAPLPLLGCWLGPMPASVGHPLAGAPAPEFREVATSDREVGLPGSPRTKVTVVDFWASWCGTCQDALPALDALWRDKQRDGVMVIAVSVDESTDDAMLALQHMHLSFPVVLDPGMRLAGTFAVGSIPTTFVVDSKGLVRWVGHDPASARRAVEVVLHE
jgi:cytochrome c biogenesis protein CcmG/thiol:disulfide interchange protein DsbE